MIYFIDIEEGTKVLIDCPVGEWLSDWCESMDEQYKSIFDFNNNEEYYRLEVHVMTIEQNIYFYEDEDGNKVYDIEGMVKELLLKLKSLDPSIRHLHVTW